MGWFLCRKVLIRAIDLHITKPVGGGCLEEFGYGDTLAADQELGGGMVGFIEGGDAGEGLFAAAAFDFDGDEGVAALEHEIDFLVLLAPVGDGDSGADGGVDEVGTDGGFDQASPGIAIGAPCIWTAAGLGGHEGGVEDLQFGTRSALADLGSGKLLQASDHARAFEELEVMGKGDGVAGVHELAEHFLIGENLSGIGTGELEQTPEQGGLVHSGEQQDVAGEGGFDQRVVDVLPPAVGIVRQRSGTGIGTEEQEFFEIPTKGFLHFGEGPVRNGDGFKAACQALGETGLDEKRRGAEQHHFQRCGVMGVGVPEQFHNLRPPGGLLDFIDHQQRTLGVVAGLDSGEVPLLLQPCLVAECGLVGGGVVRGKSGSLHDLPCQSGLAHLAGTCQHLDETARLVDPGKQLGVEMGAFHDIYSGR